MNLAGQNIAVFDLEIKNEIDGKRITWGDHHLMGISVGVAFHYKTMEYHVFMDDNLEELPALLNSCDLVSGFNITGFDNPLINGTTQLKLADGLNIYDLLVESRMASGWREGNKFPRGMKLDEHLEHTFGAAFKKTGDGADAPKLWQSGQLGKLISYCIADVKRECQLFEHVWNDGIVKTPQHPERKLRNPKQFLETKNVYQSGLVGHA